VLPVVCLQNGVNNEREALRRFEHVYGVSVLLPAGHEEPGVVTAVSEPVPGVLPIGRYPAGTDATAEAIAADLTAAGFVSAATPDVMRWKYGKLLRNLMNSVEALAGAGAAGEAGQKIRALATDEAHRVFAAAGIDVASPEEEDEPRRRHITFGEVPGAPRGGGSSWQSLTRGTGDIEAAFLNGEIVLLGRLHGVPTPVNATLQRLATRAAAEGRRPGEVSASLILDLVT
jgi:2-dehydropantoate 2-reductase